MIASRSRGRFRAVFLSLAAIVGLAGAPFAAAIAQERSTGKSVNGGSRAAKTSAKTGKATAKRGGSRQTASRSSKGGRYGRRGAASRVAVPAPAPAPTILQSTAPPPVPVATVAPIAQALVPIAAGGITSTSARMASDLSAVLDSEGLRILPTITRSSLQDVIALAQNDKTDLAFLQADVLATLPEAERPAMANRLAFVARLFNEEVHVVAGRDVNGLRDLAGKKVNVGPQRSANALTAELIFDRLGITPRYVYADHPTALAQLAAGDIAADVLVSGRPVKALQDFASDTRFKLLPVPYDRALQEIYLPARIDASDYSNLVATGRSVDTVAVGVLLATIDAPPGSPRATRVARFTQRLFEKFDALRDPARHPKWRDVNLAAEVAGWTRFAASREAIERTTARSATTEQTPPATGTAVTSGQLLAPPADADPRLYGEFLQWKRETGR